MTTPPPNDVTSGHATNVTSSTSAAAQSEGEFLWLWYVVFTIVLLGLIFASFIRFHYKRGQQLKQRLDAEMTYGVKRRQLTPSPSSSNHFTAAAAMTPVRVLAVDVEDGRKSSSPVAVTTAAAMTPAAVVNLDTQKLLTSQHHANDVRGHAGDLEVRGHQRRPRGREDGDARRAPVVYMFNANGSMVDVRCERVERCNTFRFDDDYNTDDQQHIHLPATDTDLDLERLKDIDESRRPKSCLKDSHDPLTFRSLGHAVDGDLPQSNHHPHSTQLHLAHHQYHHQQHQQQQHRQRLSPSHHRYRHRQKASPAAARRSLLHPSRFGREYLASSDEELSRSAAAAEALMLWQKR